MNRVNIVVLPVVQAVGWSESPLAEGQEQNQTLRLAVLCAGAAREPGCDDRPALDEPVIGEISYYRRYTEGLLRRYLRFSMEAGKVPSLIGRPMFRNGRVTRYRVQGFDDVVIFVHDVERCLARLTERQRALVERVALQEHTQTETAALLGMSLRTVNRRYVEAVDALSRIFLANGLMEPMIACQAACA